MKTLLKIGFLVALLLTVWFFWPSLVVPLTFLAVLTGVAAAVLAGTLAVFAGVGLAVAVTLLVVAAVVVVGLSPLWIPVVVLLGLINLFRRRSRPVATPAAA